MIIYLYESLLTENETDFPQIFVSYQWDSQDDVQALRSRLERAGYTCWMDIGQMGGGDQLNVKIDEGIRNCVVGFTDALEIVWHM